jgi:flagellar FliL protein
MAEDSSTEKEEEEEKAPEEEGDSENGEKKKGKGLKLAIIGVLVIAVLGGGGYFALGMLSSDEEGGGKANSAKDEKSTEPLPLYRMKTFIANLAGGRGRRYLKVTMAMELSSQETENEMKQKLPQLRDEVLTILSSKAFEDIKDADGKVKLRKEIAEKANRVIRTGKVRKVYFTEFVVQ